MPTWIGFVLQLLAQLSVPATAVTLILTAVGVRSRRRQDASNRRRAVVVQVLDSLELTVSRRTSIKGWLLPAAEIEWALTYPRLFLELDPRDRVIAGWMWRQVQLMLLEPDDKKQVAIASRIGGQVLGWQQGTVSVAWFERELQADPVQHLFTVPKNVQVRRMLRYLRRGLIAGGLLFASRQAWLLAT